MERRQDAPPTPRLGGAIAATRQASRSDIAQDLMARGVIEQDTFGQLAMRNFSDSAIQMAIDREWIDEAAARQLRGESSAAAAPSQEHRKKALQFMNQYSSRLDTGVPIANLPGGVKLNDMTPREMVDALNYMSGGQYELITRSSNLPTAAGAQIKVGTPVIRRKRT